MAANLLQYSDKQRIEILKAFDRTPDTIKQDIKAIQTWLEKQPHLPEKTSDIIIERFLLLNKFSVEKAKDKIDMYYTIRRLIPEFFDELPDAPRMQKSMDVMYSLPLPKLTPDLYRVIVCKLRNTNSDEFDSTASFCIMKFIREVLLQYDYSLANMFVIDCAGFTLSHYLKINPNVLRRLILVIEKVYSSRIKAVLFVNVDPLVDVFVTLAKACLPSKLADRVVTSRDLGAVHRHIPKDMLPKDLGGEDISLSELNERWREVLLEFKPRFVALRKMRVNEQLRPGKPLNSDFLGIHGNFRKLDVD